MIAFHDKALAPQPVVALDPLASDAWRDAPLLEVMAATVDVVRRINVQFAWPTLSVPRLAGDRRRIDQFLEGHRGSGHAERPGNAIAIDDRMPLAAEFAAIGRVRSGVRVPGEATLAASRLARRRSSLSARRNSASRT